MPNTHREELEKIAKFMTEKTGKTHNVGFCNDCCSAQIFVKLEDGSWKCISGTCPAEERRINRALKKARGF